ncbi:hypothetical protein BSKO_13037 [Bryopsis sp. KO-2023]|nr:hypothetical protein BSKO_13037 [Bryopsis sp. KO-2023]
MQSHGVRFLSGPFACRRFGSCLPLGGGRNWISTAYRRNCITCAAPTESAVSDEKKGKSKKSKKSKGPQATSNLEEVRQVRIEKAAQLQENGRNPYAYRFDPTHKAAQLQKDFEYLEDGEGADESVSVCVAGRLMASRVMGKLAFLRLRDDSGAVQLYVDKKRLEENREGAYAELKKLVDVGDIVGAKGGMKKTDKGEISIVVDSLEILTKCLRPLPDKWHGLTDIEKRYRQRYVDMIMNPDVKETFVTRAKCVSHVRRFLEERSFLEVETPILESEAFGADAEPFVTYHNSLDKTLTMRIATELRLKRMVVGGFDRVFEIGRIFRNEGVSTKHNPEFTSVEVYQAYADYTDMMDLTEELVRSCIDMVYPDSKAPYGEGTIDFSKPFRRVTMSDSVADATGINFGEFADDQLEEAKAAATEALRKIETAGDSLRKVAAAPTIGHLLNEMFEAVVEESLWEPTFVMDHPLEISPLAKPHRSKPGSVERFELFIAGRELANSFSELTDPIDQRKRLEAQVAGQEKTQASQNGTEGAPKGKGLAYEVRMDEDFLIALEHGMPPTGGMGLGIDRLVMLMTNSASIRDVIPFPLLK